MKKISTLLIIAALGMIGTNVMAQDKEPFAFMENAVLHGLVVSYPHDYAIYLQALYGDSTFSNQESLRIQKEGKKHRASITYSFHGNMADYKISFDTVYVGYHVWFHEEQGEGPLCVHYRIGKWSSGSDNWMNTRFPKMTNSPPFHDSDDDFQAHAQIISQMMRADLFIPTDLTVRLADNMADHNYLQCFKEIAVTHGLEVEEAEGNLCVWNGSRSYTMSRYRKWWTPLWDVIPKW